MLFPVINFYALPGSNRLIFISMFETWEVEDQRRWCSRELCQHAATSTAEPPRHCPALHGGRARGTQTFSPSPGSQQTDQYLHQRPRSKPGLGIRDRRAALPNLPESPRHPTGICRGSRTTQGSVPWGCSGLHRAAPVKPDGTLPRFHKSSGSSGARDPHTSVETTKAGQEEMLVCPQAAFCCGSRSLGL